MIYIHARTKNLSEAPTIYLLSAASILTVTRSIWLVRTIYWNFKIGNKLPRATMEKDGDVMIMFVTLPRRRDFKAGQHINICIPSLGCFQWHPFALSSCELVNENTIIRLLIKERNGFTARLANIRNPDEEMVAFIDGPYGRRIELRTYGTVLLFASGIGIAGLLFYAQQTLEEYDEQRTSCRRILLFWETDDGPAYGGKIESYLHILATHSVGTDTLELVQGLT